MASNRQYNQEYYIKNKESIDEKNKEYAKENRSRISSKNKEWRLLNKDKLKKQQKESYQQLTPKEKKDRDLKGKYKITLETYTEMLIKQEYKCACCGISEKDLAVKYPNSSHSGLCVDHCHTSLKVRALLCHACNTLIGFLEKRKDIVPTALKYIEDHGKK